MEKHTSIFDSLKEQALSYSADDYRTDAPYQRIRSLAHDNVIRYIQYLNVLLADAEKKGVPYDEAKAQSDKVQLQMDCPWAHNFLSRVAYEGQKPDAYKKVRVLPLMCGSGKSAAISQIMAERIEEHLFYQNPENQEKLNDPVLARMAQEYGILVVTDDIERMRGYMAPSKQAYAAKALIDHPELVTIMTSENRLEAMKTCAHTPVFVMTSQRYSKLSMEEIDAFLRWDHGYRKLVIFDEQPIMLQYAEISNTTLNAVNSSLADHILDFAEKEDKDWCLQQWKKATERIVAQLYELEHKYWTTGKDKPHAHCYFSFPENTAFTEDDDRFMDFVERHEAQLNNSYWTIHAVQQLLRDGAVYCYAKTKKQYINMFSVVLDLRFKITDIAADVIIFDGTGDIVPEYINDAFAVDQELGQAFRRDLSHLNVVFVDQNTSKRRMKQDDDHAELKAMVEMLETEWKNEDGAIFTYKSEEAALRRIVEEAGWNKKFQIQHFGAIRGSNLYRNLSHLAQIGLFSRTPNQYLSLFLHHDAEGMAQFRQYALDEGNQWLNAYLETNAHYRDNMDRYLLADIEQNLFRGAIRNAQFTEPYQYYIFCRKESGWFIQEKMKERYPEATFIWKETPDNIVLEKARNRNGKDATVVQKIIAYYDSLPSGTVFTSRDIIEATGITKNQWDERRKDSHAIQAILEKCRFGKSLKYRKP